MSTEQPFAQRIRDWDDYVEDHDREQAVKPFDAGIMLAVATLFQAWDEAIDGGDEHPWIPGARIKPVVEAMKKLRETVEQVIE